MLKYWIILILILYSCDNITSPEIDSESSDFEEEYAINLEALNVGNYFNLCTLQWNQHSNAEGYILRNSDVISEEEITTTSFVIQSTPGLFQKIYLDIILEPTITDSIEIYTRPIKPITNLSAAANAENWFTTLIWNSSEEIDSIFQQYNIYRSEGSLDNFLLIDNLIQQNDSSYIDSTTTWGYEYYYKIEIQTIQDYLRNSIIKSNIFDNINNNEISLNTLSNQYNQVTLNWEHGLNQQEFYAIEIWRTDDESMDPLNDYLLATVIDYDKISLEDSHLIGSGISWFYKLKIIDQFGNINYSTIVSGNTHP